MVCWSSQVYGQWLFDCLRHLMDPSSLINVHIDQNHCNHWKFYKTKPSFSARSIFHATLYSFPSRERIIYYDPTLPNSINTSTLIRWQAARGSYLVIPSCAPCTTMASASRKQTGRNTIITEAGRWTGFPRVSPFHYLTSCMPEDYPPLTSTSGFHKGVLLLMKP